MTEKSYAGDCLVHARKLAELLRAGGKEARIAYVRKTEAHPKGTMHHPLMPLRFRGAVTFTTHYVCVSEGLAWDPIAAEPLPLESYARTIFGDDLPLTFAPP